MKAAGHEKVFCGTQKGRIVLLLTLFFAGNNLMSAGLQDPDYPKGTITVTGRVRLVGTALFSSLVVTDNRNRDWYVEGADREKLARLEQRQVTVTGTAEYRDIVLADGEKAGVRRFLRNIKVK
jgi:hypothetical protein